MVLRMSRPSISPRGASTYHPSSGSGEQLVLSAGHGDEAPEMMSGCEVACATVPQLLWGDLAALAGMKGGAAHQNSPCGAFHGFRVTCPVQGPWGVPFFPFHSSILKSGLWPQFPLPWVPQTMVGSSKAPGYCPGYTHFPMYHPLANEPHPGTMMPPVLSSPPD